jgi:PadR family transcriptional regulator, regulatory protein AphA
MITEVSPSLYSEQEHIYSRQEHMSSSDGRQLTTTSYAILCLLAIRPWSTYELAQQMRRSLHHIWPRAESNVYAEPKRLVEAGLADAEVQTVGKRPRTLYTITPKGREAIENWLDSESSPSRVESEPLVKVLFGNYGTKETLLRNLQAIAAEAEAVKELWRVVASEYDRGTHVFADRVHVNALIFRWIWEHAELNARWAQWAIAQVEQWSDTSERADIDGALDVFRSVLRPAAPSSRPS